MSYSQDSGLAHCHFFFVDIVGLSDPTASTKLQIKKIDFLNKSIADCIAFKSTPQNHKIILPTGDGMAIGFIQGSEELPLQLAIELHEKIKHFNKGKVPVESIGVRIGIHSGPVFMVNDVNGNRNVWGPGIIIARRIMDLGDDDHILLSSRVAEDLSQISDYYKKCLFFIGEHVFKHNVKIRIYSAYSTSGKQTFGNSKLPEKIKKSPNDYLYPHIGVNLSIVDPKTMLVHYKRLYEIQSLSDEPISEVNHQIATDVEKTFEELNLKIYDEDGNDMKITNIKVDKPLQKDFDTSFSTPLEKGQGLRYFLEYDIEEPERYFENIFLTNCEKFVTTVDFPVNAGIRNPVVYEVNLENEEKIKTKNQPILVEETNGRRTVRWAKKNIRKGQSFRFEW